jgi:oxygen-independent coproporphyrinogen-3 oxidase
MIGLGVSSISDSWYAFAQNEKSIENYYTLLKNNEIPVIKGHILTPEDLIIRKHILNLMCALSTNLADDWDKIDFEPILAELSEFVIDKLLTINGFEIKVTQKGRAFIRNICMAFDLRLQQNQPERQLFSMII